MMVVEEQENEISIDITQLINDYNLCKQSKDLKPLSKKLNILQKDFVTVANSYLIILKKDILESHHQLI